MTGEQPRSHDELFEDADALRALLDSADSHLARAQALLDSFQVRPAVTREHLEFHYNQARNYFSGASLVGGIAVAVATNSFWFGVAAGVGLKWASRGLEHLGQGNAFTQHYAGLLINAETTDSMDKTVAQPATIPTETQDQESAPGA